MAESLKSLRGRCGAHVMHSRNDSTAVSQAARDAFLRTFYDEVDPDRVLPEKPSAKDRRPPVPTGAFWLAKPYGQSSGRSVCSCAALPGRLVNGSPSTNGAGFLRRLASRIGGRYVGRWHFPRQTCLGTGGSTSA